MATTVDPFVRRSVDADTFRNVLVRVAAVLDAVGCPWALIGGLPSAVYGRPRSTDDIDVLLRPADAPAALSALGVDGFLTDERDPAWLFKAIDRGVLVDLIFRTTGVTDLDDEMLGRLRHHTARGVRVPLVPPEDLVIIKATAFKERRPQHWYDALAVIERTPLDWDYFERRARAAASRVLALLFFARGEGVVVPCRVVDSLLAHANG
jgi:hypothetical protein